VVPNAGDQTSPISTFCIALHIFMVGENRDFKFGMQVDHSKSQPTEDKMLLKGASSCHMTYFKFLVSYNISGMAKARLQILYTGCPYKVLAFGQQTIPQVDMVTFT